MATVVVPNAAYSWWVHPEAAIDPHTGDTWFVSITTDGQNQVHRIDAETGTLSTINVGPVGDMDDHNGGSVAIDPDNPAAPVLVFVIRHNTETHLRMYRVDRETMDVLSTADHGDEQEVSFTTNCTYAQAWMWDGTLTVWTRSPTSSWKYRRTDDWGDNWGPERTMFVRPASQTSGQVYCTSYQVGAVVHFAMYGHPTSSNYHSIHYCRVNLATGLIVTEEGNVLGRLDDDGGPAIPIDFGTIVYTAPGETTTRLFAVGLVGGRPAVAYATWPLAQDPIEGGDYWMTTGVESGQDWPRVGLGHSGHGFGYTYIGGMAIDSDNGNVWIARNTDDAGAGGAWQIERRFGLAWQGVEVVESISPGGDVESLARPYTVANSDYVIWQRVTEYGPSFTNYEMDSVLYEFSDAPPVMPVPPIRQPVARTTVTWVACDLATGRVIEELPEVIGTISRVLGAYATGALTIPIPRSGPAAVGIRRYEQATEPRRTKIVAIINDVPTWEGMVVARLGGNGAVGELSVATMEGYFDRRYVGNHSFEQRDEVDVIMRALVNDATTLEGIGQGVAMAYDMPPTGTLRNRDYLFSEHRKVYAALQSLMAGRNGPEWTVEPRWDSVDELDAIVSVMVARKRIGRDTDAVFTAAKPSEAAYQLNENHSDGYGSNAVYAYSGQGEQVLTSDPMVDVDQLAAGAPIFEHHFQPSTSITRKSTLNNYAIENLLLTRYGTVTFEAEARWDAYPRMNLDWQLGDTVEFQVKGHRHPSGLTFRGRVIGWTLDIARGVIEPTLVNTREVTE